MSSLYKDYIKERQGREVLEYDDGFATYEIDGDYIYLADIYVVPEKRGKKRSSEIADKVSEIGKEKSCKYLLGSVDPLDENYLRSIGVLINYGYEYWKKDKKGLMIFKKEL